MHIKLTNGQPEIYSIGQLRRDNPQTSFPKVPSDDLLSSYSVYSYTRPDRPNVDWMTSSVIDGNFEQDSNGNWIQTYITEQLPLVDAQNNVRRQRDTLLQQTDWMALSDVVMSPEMTTYRQVLRDITLQEEFPYNIIWPTKP